jgi:hypothetical protein
VLEDLDEPLPARDELERPLALLVELDGVRHRLRGPHQRDSGAVRRALLLREKLDDAPLRLLDGQARKLVVRPSRRFGIEGRERRAAVGDRQEPAVTPDDLLHRQAGLLPPRDVHRVAERADHEDARPLVGIGVVRREDRHRRAEERRDRVLPEERPVALVIRMGHHRDARGQELWSGRGDQEVAAAFDAEPDVVEEPGPIPVHDLRLGHRRLEVHVPHRGRRLLVDEALLDEVEERELGDATAVLVDGRVLAGPVEREAEPPPEALERLLVLGGHERAGLDEAPPRDQLRLRLPLPDALPARRVGLPLGVERDLRLAADPEEVLHAPLGRQAVVVPAHRERDVHALHALVAHDQVLVRVAEDVADVQLPGDRRRRRVHHERLLARPARVPTVDGPLLPPRAPALLRGGVVVLLRQIGHGPLR